MTDTKDMRKYLLERNAGKLPWEIEDSEQSSGQRPQASQSRVQALPEDFKPDPVYVEFLELHHNIPPEFTLNQIGGFKQYWLETGEKRKAWQNKFKNHVIYQWEKQPSVKGDKMTIPKFSDESPSRRKIAAMLLQGMVRDSQDCLHDSSKQEELVTCAVAMADLLIKKLDLPEQD